MAKYDYSVTHLFEDVSDTNSALLRLQTGDSGVDALIIFSSGGQCLLEVETGTTFSDDGTSETIYERNEMDAGSPSSSAWHTPTVDSSGDSQDDGWIPGGGRGVNKIGGKNGSDDSLVWSPNTEHLVKATNTSGGTSDIFVKILFNEV